MVSRHGLLLERALVLLVDDDQPELPRRCENGRPDADDDLDLARGDALPVPMPFGVAEVAVEDGDPGEPATEPSDRLRRQADLGDQHDRLPSPRHDPLDRRKVDLGLAAAGHSVDQERGEAARLQYRLDPRQNRRLLGGQDQRGPIGRLAGRSSPCGDGRVRRTVGSGVSRQAHRQSTADRVHQSQLLERLDRYRAALGQPADVGRRERIVGSGEDLEHGRLLGREPGLDRPGPQGLTRLLGDKEKRPDPGSRVLLHARRHGGIECLAPGAGIILRQPLRQLEHTGVDQGGRIEDLDHVLDPHRIEARGGLLIDPHAIADRQLVAPPQRHADALTGPDLPGQPDRDPVGQDLLDRPVEHNTREHAAGQGLVVID